MITEIKEKRKKAKNRYINEISAHENETKGQISSQDNQ